MLKRIAVFSTFTAVAFPLLANDDGWVAYSQTIFSLVVVGIAVFVGILALAWTYKNRYRGKDSFLIFAWKNPLVKLVLGILTVVAGVKRNDNVRTASI